MRKKGFTLIELLVVIAIIAILAAILFPVFAKAREKARQTSCLSNEKQMALGMVMYAQDYDGFFPLKWHVGTGTPSPSDPTGFLDNWVWYDFAQSYVKNYQILHCPSFTDSAQGAYKFGYCVNENITTGYYTSNADHHDNTVSESSIKSSADTYMILEGAMITAGVWDGIAPIATTTGVIAYIPGTGKMPHWQNTPLTFSGTPSAWGLCVMPSNLQTDIMDGRHSGMVNVAFCDGHAKALKGAVIYQEGNKGIDIQSGMHLSGATTPTASAYLP